MCSLIDGGILKDKERNIICQNHVVNLDKLQTTQEQRLRKKLKTLILTDTHDNEIFFSRRKTIFYRLLCSVKSVESIFCDWVEPENFPLKHLHTYKLSQRHLAFFLGAIRSCAGFNNILLQDKLLLPSSDCCYGVALRMVRVECPR